MGGASGSGDGEASALGISLEPVEAAAPIRYNKQELERLHGLKRPRRDKATLGLAYITYGMEEKNRHYAPAGSRWKLTVIASKAGILSSQRVLDQARCALWLLTNFGGVGSKGRKGFGGLETDAGIVNLEECRKHASELRAAISLSDRHSDSLRDSPSLENMLGPVALTLPGDDVWWAMDQIGDAIQEFAQDHRHNPEKKGLGLPRRMQEQDSELGNLTRHASPVHFHLSSDNSGFKATVVAFPSAKLRSFDKNREFLQKFIEHLRGKAFTPPPARTRPDLPAAGPTPKPRAALRVGDLVEATLLEEKTKKGGWKAQEKLTGLSGPIQNTQAVPSAANAGDSVNLRVKVASPAPAFEYVSGKA